MWRYWMSWRGQVSWLVLTGRCWFRWICRMAGAPYEYVHPTFVHSKMLRLLVVGPDELVQVPLAGSDEALFA